MRINEHAPVRAVGEVDIPARPESIWPVLAELDRWPGWNPDIGEVQVQGPLEPGTRFRWKSGPGWITSVLREFDPPRLLGWTGTTFAIRAVHIYRLIPQNGTTRVRLEESREGLPASVLRRPFRRTLQRAIDSGLERLKADVERRPALHRERAVTPP